MPIGETPIPKGLASHDLAHLTIVNAAEDLPILRLAGLLRAHEDRELLLLSQLGLRDQ